MLDDVATWLPAATVLVGAAAIACSVRRRRTGVVVAVAVAAVMVVIAIVAAVGRAYYLDHVGNAYRSIAGAPFDALVAPLRAWTRLTFALALLAAFVAWFTGSATLVEREHDVRRVALETVRHNARLFEIGGAATAAVVLVGWDKPRPLVVFSTLAVLAGWEAACFAVARPGPHPPRPGRAGGPGATPAPN